MTSCKEVKKPLVKTDVGIMKVSIAPGRARLNERKVLSCHFAADELMCHTCNRSSSGRSLGSSHCEAIKQEIAHLEAPRLRNYFRGTAEARRYTLACRKH